MAEIWADKYFGQADKTKLLVALSLADFANDEGYSWPSIETLANKARTSIRGAQEVCREMESDKILTVIIAAGRNGTNLYRLTPATVAPPRIGAALKAAEEAALGAALRCTQSVRKRKEVIKNHQETELSLSLGEPSKSVNTKTCSRSEALDGFEDFWVIYPRKVGKGNAEKAWMKMECAQRILKIATAVKIAKQSEDWKGEKRFIPHPATWLNQKRWEDELTPSVSRAIAPTHDENDRL